MSRRNYSLSLKGSGEKWERKGKGWGNERERDMNENAYAPRTHRIPLVFYFDKEPRLHYTGEMKISAIVASRNSVGI